MSKIYLQIEADMKSAMLAKDAEKLKVLRGIKAEFDLAKSEKNAKPFDDAKALELLTRLKKQRNESLDFATKAGREDLKTEAINGAAIIASYMPAEASGEKVLELISNAYGTLGSNLGAIIKEVKANLQTEGLSFDGGKLAKLVKESIEKL